MPNPPREVNSLKVYDALQALIESARAGGPQTVKQDIVATEIAKQLVQDRKTEIQQLPDEAREILRTFAQSLLQATELE